MAITASLSRLLSSLEVQQGSTLLEIGEANWYGNNPSPIETDNLFEAAKAFYRQWFNPSSIVSIDMNGSPDALRLDLNQPMDAGEQFDIVINHGTAEHIFNIAQVFRSMHNACEDGGLMIHDAPFTGWVDHGFYCLQPTLFYDLARANCYEIVKVAIHSLEGAIINVDGRDHIAQLQKWRQIPANAQLFVAFQKYGDQPFKIPTQGYYARTLSEAGNRAWECLR